MLLLFSQLLLIVSSALANQPIRDEELIKHLRSCALKNQIGPESIGVRSGSYPTDNFRPGQGPGYDYILLAAYGLESKYRHGDTIKLNLHLGRQRFQSEDFPLFKRPYGFDAWMIGISPKSREMSFYMYDGESFQPTLETVQDFSWKIPNKLPIGKHLFRLCIRYESRSWEIWPKVYGFMKEIEIIE